MSIGAQSCAEGTVCKWSALSVGYSTFGQIVGRQLYGDRVARYNTDKMLPHLPGNMRNNLMAVFKFDTKLSTRQGLDNYAVQFDDFLITRHRFLRLTSIAFFTTSCKVFYEFFTSCFCSRFSLGFGAAHLERSEVLLRPDLQQPNHFLPESRRKSHRDYIGHR